MPLATRARIAAILVATAARALAKALLILALILLNVRFAAKALNELVVAIARFRIAVRLFVTLVRIFAMLFATDTCALANVRLMLAPISAQVIARIDAAAARTELLIATALVRMAFKALVAPVRIAVICTATAARALAKALLILALMPDQPSARKAAAL